MICREGCLGTEQQQEKCEQLAIRYRCTRKNLLIREITCKENPIQQKLRTYAFCPGDNCVRVFQYKKALYNHLIQSHLYTPGSSLLYDL